jgi:hypothetical protein
MSTLGIVGAAKIGSADKAIASPVVLEEEERSCWNKKRQCVYHLGAVHT